MLLMVPVAAAAFGSFKANRTVWDRQFTECHAGEGEGNHQQCTGRRVGKGNLPCAQFETAGETRADTRGIRENLRLAFSRPPSVLGVQARRRR